MNIYLKKNQNNAYPESYKKEFFMLSSRKLQIEYSFFFKNNSFFLFVRKEK